MSVKLFSRLYQTDTIATDNTYIFCTNGSSISRIKITTKEIVDVWNTTLITSKYDSPQKLYYNNNVLYATNNTSLKSINVTNGQTDGVVTTIMTLETNLFGMIIHNNNLYISDETKIYKISLSDNSLSTFATKISSGSDYLTIYNNYLYVSSTNNKVNRYNITTGSLDSWSLTLPGPRGVCINNGILYILNISNDTICSVNLTVANPTATVLQNVSTNSANDLVSVNNILYIANTGLNNILSYDTNTTLFRSYLSGLLGDPVTNNSGMCFLNKIYISNYWNDSIYEYNNGMTSFNTGIINVVGICNDLTSLYVSSSNRIYHLDTDGFVLESFDSLVQAVNMVIKNNILYFTSSNSLYKLNLSTGTVTNLNTSSTGCVGLTLLNNNLYICCSDAIYVYNITTNSYTNFINRAASKITNDGTYLYFSYNGVIYKSNTSGTYETLLYKANHINGLIYTDKLYYLTKGILYSYSLVPIINNINPQYGMPGSTSIINGVNLTNVNNVYFGNSTLTNYQIIDDYSISITIPIGFDNVNVFVSSPAGDSEILVFGLPTSYSICFIAGTLIQTDQGKISIEKINNKNTIHKKKIVAVTKTKYDTEESLVCFEKDSIQKNYPRKRTIISRKHKILHKNVFTEAETFINKDTIYEIKYNGEILYNILLEKHYSMRVHNLICETLHPENKVALFYKQKIKEGISADEILIHFKKLSV